MAPKPLKYGGRVEGCGRLHTLPEDWSSPLYTTADEADQAAARIGRSLGRLDVYNVVPVTVAGGETRFVLAGVQRLVKGRPLRALRAKAQRRITPRPRARRRRSATRGSPGSRPAGDEP